MKAIKNVSQASDGLTGTEELQKIWMKLVIRMNILKSGKLKEKQIRWRFADTYYYDGSDDSKYLWVISEQCGNVTKRSAQNES